MLTFRTSTAMIAESTVTRTAEATVRAFFFCRGSTGAHVTSPCAAVGG
jgi:hypothetical protein